MRTLFVSDVHLSAARPAMVSRFLEFLSVDAPASQALFILGDCFDRWLGDDDDTPPHAEVLSALADLTAAGLPVSVLRGNHDFLLGEAFAHATGCELLEDPSVVEVHGTPVLLMHGDSLCTDDHAYQAFRRYARDPGNQAAFLALPLAARAAEADRLRERSKTQTRLKPEQIMDVNAGAVAEVMREHAVSHLIHGHTHRPAIHDLQVDGRAARRIVLGDWYERDQLAVWDEHGPRHARIDDLRRGL